MIKKLFVSAVFFLLFTQIANAVTLTLETEPNWDVSIFIQDSTTNYLIESFYRNSGSEGEAIVEFTTSEPEVDALVKIKNNNVELYSKRFESLSTLGPIEIELPEREDECDAEHLEFCTTQQDCESTGFFWYNESCNAEECDPQNLELCTASEKCSGLGGFWYDEKCNIQEKLIEKTENETTEKKAPVTGFSVFGEKGINFFSNKIFWIVVISLVAIIIFALYAKHRLDTPPVYKTKLKIPHNQKALEHELLSAERKLKEARTEINHLKNMGKIDEAKRKIEEDKEVLRKLERGEI